MAQYMALREAEPSGFKIIVRCVNSAKEMGQHIAGRADGRIEYRVVPRRRTGEYRRHRSH